MYGTTPALSDGHGACRCLLEVYRRSIDSHGLAFRCVLELHAIAAKKEDGGAEFAVAMTMQERKHFLDGIKREREYLKMLGTVNAERSECSRQADRESIHTAIRDSIGFAKLNRMLFGVMEEWIEGQLLAELAASRARGNDDDAMVWIQTLGLVYGEQGRHKDAMVMEEELCAYFQRESGDCTQPGSCDYNGALIETNTNRWITLNVLNE